MDISKHFWVPVYVLTRRKNNGCHEKKIMLFVAHTYIQEDYENGNTLEMSYMVASTFYGCYTRNRTSLNNYVSRTQAKQFLIKKHNCVMIV